jgi:3-hydroxyisobutyrate dehydrogenase-like beta-hydroxyacid dehydrogenase
MKLGFIGTVNKDNPIAVNVALIGLQTTVHYLSREAAANPRETGAQRADRPRRAVPDNEAAVTSPPGHRDGEAVGQVEKGTQESAAS